MPLKSLYCLGLCSPPPPTLPRSYLLKPFSKLNEILYGYIIPLEHTPIPYRLISYNWHIQHGERAHL